MKVKSASHLIITGMHSQLLWCRKFSSLGLLSGYRWGLIDEVRHQRWWPNWVMVDMLYWRRERRRSSWGGYCKRWLWGDFFQYFKRLWTMTRRKRGKWLLCSSYSKRNLSLKRNWWWGKRLGMVDGGAWWWWRRRFLKFVTSNSSNT